MSELHGQMQNNLSMARENSQMVDNLEKKGEILE